MSKTTAIFWFRNDFRLADNQALVDALAQHEYVLPVYIHAPEEEGLWTPGAASRWWLHHSLAALDDSLHAVGTQLLIELGPATATLSSLAHHTSAVAVYFNRRYEPWALRQEAAVIEHLTEHAVECHVSQGNLLFEPGDLMTMEGNPYKVFTPFWRALLTREEPRQPCPPPTQITRLHSAPSGVPLSELDLLPSIDWAGGIRGAWRPGEVGALSALEHFLDSGLASYSLGRNRPDQELVSRISPHLHFGEISARTIWHAVKRQAVFKLNQPAEGQQYLRELAWREFAHHLLYFFPATTEQPLRREFAEFPWAEDDIRRFAWEHGKTGFPIVDAGMRELWHTGWMHNRVRMVAASFLVKDLMISWLEGARWFWDTLVDADLANNTLGWQWSAGCGADAAPYFRVFNPTLQGQHFDPDGEYVRRWVPELSGLSNRWIHSPWTAPPLELSQAGVTLGETYPFPLVDHGIARQRALAAFQSIKIMH